MAYKKNISQEERRIRELAAALKNNSQTKIRVKGLNSEPDRHPELKTQEILIGSGQEIKSDIVKVSVIAAVILGTQIIVGLTSF